MSAQVQENDLAKGDGITVIQNHPSLQEQVTTGDSLSLPQKEPHQELDTVEVAVAEKVSDLDTVEVAVAEKVSDLDTVEVAVAEKVSDLDTVEVAVAEKVSDLDTVEVAAAEKVSDLDTVEVAVAEKVSDLGTVEVAEKASELKEHDVIDEETTQAEKIESELASELAENNGWVQILGNDQLMKKIVKEGIPNTRPLRGDVCIINLTGCLAEDESVVFQPQEKLTIQLGDAEVISGLDLAIPLMCKGEISSISISPRFGFGAKGLSPHVPKDAWLMYNVELIEFEPEKELHELTVSQRRQIGNRKREKGNWWYSRGEHGSAVQCYRRALEFLDEVEGGISFPKENEDKNSAIDSPDEVKFLFEDRLKTYNNMAAAQLKLQAYGPALKSVDAVLKCQPQNVKALYRKGTILASKGDTTDAIKVLREALNLEPGNTAILQELKKITAKRKEEKENEQILYKRMFNTSSEGNGKTSTDSKSAFKRPFNLAMVAGGIIVAIAGVMAYRYAS